MGSEGRRFRRRLLAFLLPYVAAGAAVSAILARTGELLSLDTVAWLQTTGLPFIYETKYSDHTYHLKASATRRINPQVLALGPSRMLQWRREMFAPLSFYNAGRAANTQYDFGRFLRAAEPATPAVVLFSIEFFSMHPLWDDIFKNRSREDRGGLGSAEQATIIRSMWKEVRPAPELLFRNAREPVYGITALGFRAAQDGNGIRPDGSYHYGGIIAELPNQGVDTIEDTLIRVRGGHAPFPGAKSLDRERMSELERFAAYARARGIRLIAMTPPYAREIVGALNASPLHDNWRQFQSEATGEWIRGLGIEYFNFTDLDSFGGKANEFVDPFHPSETASVRMLIAMLQRPSTRALLPGVDTEALRGRLAGATRLVVFRP